MSNIKRRHAGFIHNETVVHANVLKYITLPKLPHPPRVLLLLLSSSPFLVSLWEQNTTHKGSVAIHPVTIKIIPQ